MGRRSVPLSDPDRWVFNRLAHAYASRPAYPEALADRLAELAGGPGRRVVDLGAGTGQLALPLEARGLCVAAVEPAREMLAVLASRLRPGAAVRPVAAAAEATGLESAAFDLVLVADALHWVDPELAGHEAARLRAERGVVAVVEATFAPTPFMEGLQALLRRENPKARRRPPGAVRQFLALAAGGTLREERFPHEALLHGPQLAAVVRSLSYAGPALSPRALARLLGDVEALARREDGARFARLLTLRWAAGRRRRRA
jgi:ubiquinone/menaquinone biosynthesis C-methylase UbiE